MNRTANNEDRKIDRPNIYMIKLQGRLDEKWSSWLDGMGIEYEDGLTVLRGEVPDQAALRGLLIKIWDMNQTLISIELENGPRQPLNRKEKSGKRKNGETLDRE